MKRVPLIVVLAAAIVLPHGARCADPCATLAGTVSGTVTATGGAPLAGARVRVQGCLGEPVMTDGAGNFTLSVPAGSLVIAAGAAGHYNGCIKPPGAPDCRTAAAGAAGVAIVLDPLPTDDDPAYTYRDPTTCERCHADTFEQWNRSTMAHTNQNRWVDNLYNGTDLTAPPGPPTDPQNPPYFGFLSRHNVDAVHPTRNGECANCHQPEYVGAAPTNTSFNAFSGADKHGIACDFCHKITDVDVSPAGIGRPNLVVGAAGLPAKTTMLRSPSQPWLELGPLDDVTFPGVPDMRAAHGLVTGSSRVCAACHEDNNDPRDTAGDFREVYDGPASQLTYTEWAASPYAAQGVQCQDCHMPPTGADQFCSQTSNKRDPSQVRSHVFEGTTPEFLHRAVRLHTGAVVDGDHVTLTADLSNVGAGHHVPTGVTLRNLILVVSAKDRAGTRLQQLDGPTVPNWGGVGDPAEGGLAGLPGKGYARVLVDEFLAENVLFTEAVRAFDNRIAAGATDTTRYTFALPARWQKQDVRITTQLYYRRAFKPIADQRKWNVPLGANRHGTRGDGSDYDENFVTASVTSFLTCRGKFGKLAATLTPAGGLLDVTATLMLPHGITLDPVASGVQLALGDATRPGSVVQEQVTGFTQDGLNATHDGESTDPIHSLRFKRGGRRVFRMTVGARGLDLATIPPKLVFGVDSGDVCFRKALHCKRRRETLRCR